VKLESNNPEKFEKDKIPLSTNVEKNATFVSDTKPVEKFTRAEKKKFAKSVIVLLKKITENQRNE
jgi:hypothetical protein